MKSYKGVSPFREFSNRPMKLSLNKIWVYASTNNTNESRKSNNNKNACKCIAFMLLKFNEKKFHHLKYLYMKNVCVARLRLGAKKINIVKYCG